MPAGPVRLVRVGEMFNSCAPARAKSAAACPCELDSQRGVFWMFFVNTRRLYLGLVRLLKPEGRYRLHDALEARAQIQRQPIELHRRTRPHPAPAPCALNFTVAIASGKATQAGCRRASPSNCNSLFTLL